MVIFLYDGLLVAMRACLFEQLFCQILGDLLDLVEATGALTVCAGTNT